MTRSSGGLPDPDDLRIDPRKITEYLLSPVHPQGRTKARFFAAYGFSRARWQEMAAALLEHARVNEVISTRAAVDGVNYVVEGSMTTPDGRGVGVTAVWYVPDGERFARLATAYPMKEPT